MAKAYTPGLKVSARTRHRVRRQLPLAGDVLVRVGDRVQARQIVAQAFLPGDVMPLNMAKLLNMPAGDVPTCMLKKAGDSIAPGDVLARNTGIFGKFRTDYKSTVAGTIESISAVTGQIIVRGAPQPIEIRAYLTGQVVEVLPHEGCVIEGDVAFVQGIFGIGGETFGPVRMACRAHDQELADDLITSDMKGCVVIGGARMTAQAIGKARTVGVAAVISGGIDDEDLRTFLGYDLGVAITGSEQVGLTLIITEGFGEIAMAERTFRLFASHEGGEAAVNGATQIRAGVMRPEMIVPLVGAQTIGVRELASSERSLEIGAAVRIVGDPHFGLIGSVSALPPEPRVLESGSRTRVLEVRFDSGEAVIIPRANVELIEE